MTSTRLNILFPIETSSRELDYRIMLACKIARPGNRIFVGHYPVVDRLAGRWLRGGVYVGKNILEHGFRTVKSSQAKRDDHAFSSDLTLFRRLESAGFVMVHLHEEGGVFPGTEESWPAGMRRQLDPSVLGSQDWVCTWGEYQRRFFQSLEPACADHIVTTGHPRFDLYKPAYRGYWDQQVAEIEARYGRPILLNTSFAIANYTLGIKDLMFRSLGVDPADSDKRLRWFDYWARDNEGVSDFVRLAHALAARHPDRQVVLRPHPSENIDFYHNVFWNVPNLHAVREGSVGPWLLASSVMIQRGCTTGFESWLADTPVLNYIREEDDQLWTYIPAQFGRTTPTHQATLEAVDQTLGTPDARPRPETMEDPLTLDLVANLQHDAFDAVAGVVKRAEAQVSGAVHTPSGLELHTVEKLRQMATEVALSGLALIPESMDVPFGASQQRYVRSKFPGFDRDDVARRFEAACRVTGARAQLRVLSSDLLVVDGE